MSIHFAMPKFGQQPDQSHNRQQTRNRSYSNPVEAPRAADFFRKIDPETTILSEHPGFRTVAEVVDFQMQAMPENTSAPRQRILRDILTEQFEARAAMENSHLNRSIDNPLSIEQVLSPAPDLIREAENNPSESHLLNFLDTMSDFVMNFFFTTQRLSPAENEALEASYDQAARIAELRRPPDYEHPLPITDDDLPRYANRFQDLLIGDSQPFPAYERGNYRSSMPGSWQESFD